MDEIEAIRSKKMRKMMEKIQIEDLDDNSKSGSSRPIELSDGNFGDFVENNSVVLVDCWAEWCGPCKMLGPTIDQLASEYSGSLAVGKLNVDYNPMKAREFGIVGIPTMLLFKNGKLVDKIVGAVPKPEIESKLKKLF
jgi:thioredoxin 1